MAGAATESVAVIDSLARRSAPQPRILLAAGLAAALLVAVAGLALEGARLGWSDRATLARVEGQVRRQFEDMSASLRATAASLHAQQALVARAGRQPEAAPDLFDAVGAATRAAGIEDLSVTVYSASGAALAWSGRPSEIPPDRVSGPSSLFVAPGPLGLRLVYVEPLFEADATTPQGQPGVRLGTIAAERVLSPAAGVNNPRAGTFTLQTSIATVSLRTRFEGAGGVPGPDAFVIRTPSGEALLEASMRPGDVAGLRRRWRRDLLGMVLAALALTLLLLTGPILDVRARAATGRAYARATISTAVLILGGRAFFWFATPERWTGRPLLSPDAYASGAFGPLLRSPIDFLLTALTAVALVALCADPIRRWRVARRRTRRGLSDAPMRFAATQLAAGCVLAALFTAYELFLADTVENTANDTLHFAFHPVNSARLSLLFGLVCFHAAAIWTAVLTLFAATSEWRVPRANYRFAALLVALWLTPVGAAGALALTSGWPIPLVPLALAAAGCVLAAVFARAALAWYRHAARAPRLVAVFAAFATPALLMYPSVVRHAHRAKAHLIESQYALEAARHPQELQARLSQSLAQIDAIPSLAELVESAAVAADEAPQTDRAFLLWRQTDLAGYRLTSAIEIYGATGTLVSRFGLNFPEYEPPTVSYQHITCTWEISGEAVPFGSDERRELHAERGICANGGRKVGVLIVRVMLDYRALPFISSKSPYFELFRSNESSLEEGMPGRDVELVIYGWGHLPWFESGTGAWPLDDSLFERLAASRTPFWTRLARGDREYHVYFVNTREAIYAVGYPRLDALGHCIHLAEITLLAATLYLVLVVGAAVFSRVARSRGGTSRLLWLEIRQSFYRKLLLAFVGAAVVPVIVLAFVIRAYFATILRADIEEAAARTAAVARRVIEEFTAPRQSATDQVVLDDEVLVFLSTLIDQDVNIFAGPRLLATSERDLFASGLLPTRTPGEVYRAIVLQHLPSFVSEDSIGTFRYMLAAAPVRLAGRSEILTIPLALRQQEIEREIDDLDRGVYLAALVFILLGAGIGVSMAERIGDPVKRLTRASERIARGDFDARVVVKSADELQRLVHAFNSMAVELKNQQAQLERTHRLEAWAEMARQVAHEIKNPLTPIQLSAEHLRRVHADRGRPLSPVLDSCVDTILTQVRLLRQISAEFSNFASSPTARPALTSLADLVREVVTPYLEGLSDRIDVTLDLPDAVPPVFVDRTLVSRALTNIIENALHAMPGAGTLSVTIGAEDGTVQLEVADSGVGMDEEALDRIFEPYFSTKAIGTGLGLTIAKRNAELSGGTIEVRSARGRGTVVTLTFPAAGPDRS